jgi:hypothetical protein
LATKGQHVGGLRDNLSDDDGMSAARSQQRALAALARPQKQHRGPVYDIGDGDPCPLGHRKMSVIRGTNTQYCPDQSHDGRPGTARDGEAPQTRCFWPLNGFAEALRVYRSTTTPAVLPDITMEGFNA